MTSVNTLSDGSDDKKYFIIVPQIVLALCRNPYDYALWSVIKMIAGELGECTLSTTDLAKLAMMSTGKVSDSRAYLLATGLLEGKCYRDPGYPQPVWHLRVPDIWLKNAEWRQLFDALKDRIELKERMKALLDEADIFRRFNLDSFQSMNTLHNMNIKSLHNMKPSQYEHKEPSQYEEGIPQNEGGIPQNETKKNQKEKPKEKPTTRRKSAKPKKEKTPPPLAVQAYRSIARRYPDKATWSMIDESIGTNEADIKFWKEVVTAYIACGWNKINVKGMISFFETKRIPTTEPIKGNGANPNGPNRQVVSQPSETAERAKWLTEKFKQAGRGQT